MATPELAAAELVALNATIRDAQKKRKRLLQQACPGKHQLIQHRDMRPAWCEACGRGADGKQVMPRDAG